MVKLHDDVIKWKHFPRNWPFVRGIHRSPVNSPHKGQWRGALMLPLICVWINGWENNLEAGDSRRCCAHYDVTVMGDHVLKWRLIKSIRCTFYYTDNILNHLNACLILWMDSILYKCTSISRPLYVPHWNTSFIMHTHLSQRLPCDRTNITHLSAFFFVSI